MLILSVNFAVTTILHLGGVELKGSEHADILRPLIVTTIKIISDKTGKGPSHGKCADAYLSPNG